MQEPIYVPLQVTTLDDAKAHWRLSDEDVNEIAHSLCNQRRTIKRGDEFTDAYFVSDIEKFLHARQAA